MKVLLINPNWRNSLYISLPIGLASIASVLLSEGFEVKALDCSALDLDIEDIRKEIAAYGPEVIGISSMTPTIKEAESIAGAARNSSDAKIIIGGVHPSICPEEVLENRNIDFLIIGEGEITFLELCRALRDKEDFSEITGLAYSKDSHPKINPPRELIPDLDSLPIPAVRLFPLKRYRQSIGESSKFITMITSRGCPYFCTYCINSCDALFGKKYRAMSAARVIREIRFYLENLKVKEIDFYDDNFTFDTKRTEEICDMIIGNELKFRWKCSSRTESISTELLKKMKKAGCYMIAYGVESGNEGILKSVKRYTDLKKVEEVFRSTHKAGIKTLAYFMLGFPDETKQTIKDTVDLAIRINPTYAQFAIITPYPHTEIYAEYRKDNLLMIDDWSKFNYAGDLTTPVIRSKFLSSKELHEEYKKAIRKFYLRPSYILREIKTNLNPYGIKKSIRGFAQVMRWIRKE